MAARQPGCAAKYQSINERHRQYETLCYPCWSLSSCVGSSSFFLYRSGRCWLRLRGWVRTARTAWPRSPGRSSTPGPAPLFPPEWSAAAGEHPGWPAAQSSADPPAAVASGRLRRTPPMPVMLPLPMQSFSTQKPPMPPIYQTTSGRATRHPSRQPPCAPVVSPIRCLLTGDRRDSDIPRAPGAAPAPAVTTKNAHLPPSSSSVRRLIRVCALRSLPRLCSRSLC